MKPHIPLFLLLFIVWTTASAQTPAWYNTSGSPNLRFDTGYVGIATGAQNAGLGPENVFQIGPNVAGYYANDFVVSRAGRGSIAIHNDVNYSFVYCSRDIAMMAGGNFGVYVRSNGNVLVGKSSQQNSAYKFDVDGKVRCNEVVVNTDGSDFVFEATYHLPSLSEVERFIKQNKHLPEVRSAKDMQENGVALGELDTKLLQKVEELTLYMIDFEKKMSALKAENESLKARVKDLEQK